MRVRTTLVGCGAVAQKLYRKPLQTLEQQGILCVTGLVDSHRQHAATMRSFFPGAAVSADLEEAFQGNRSDLTLVLSPTRLHADHTILALKHKNHVLCEKPMATTEAKCAEVIATAHEMGRVVAIGMIRRFFPSFAQLKQWISNQELGEIRSFCYREGKVFDWDVKTPAGFCKEGGGGAGLLYDIGPHAIDLLIWLFGVPQVISYADDALSGVESNIVMQLKAPGGSGSVQLSWDCPLKNELRVLGSKGEAVLRVDQFDKLAIKKDCQFQEGTVDYHYPADMVHPSRRMMSPRLYTQSIYCQLIQVVRAIQLGEAPAVTAEVGKECVRVIESAHRQAQPIETLWLDPHQREAYRNLHWTNPQWTKSQLSEQPVSSARAWSNR